MSLLAQAIADSRMIVEDAAGFSQQLTITNPDGVVIELRGEVFDITEGIDVETGQAATVPRVSARVSAGRFTEAGLELPRGIADSKSRPWVLACTDALGRARTYKVTESRPDNTLPVLILVLEIYKL